MTSSNTPDQPEENPFEVSAGSQSEDAFEGTRTDATDESRFLMPPVESSYWTGVITLGLMIFVFCGIAGFNLGPTDVGPWDILLVMFSFGMGLLCFALPLSLIRLWMHRWSIARAIGEQRYPGGQRFGLGYLIYSLVLSTLSFFCWRNVVFWNLHSGYARYGILFQRVRRVHWYPPFFPRWIDFFPRDIASFAARGS